MHFVWDLILKPHLRVPGYAQGKFSEECFLVGAGLLVPWLSLKSQWIFLRFTCVIQLTSMHFESANPLKYQLPLCLEYS